MNLLFVCNSNLNRSPTAEKLFKKLCKHIGLNHDIKSAGTHYGYPNIVNDELLVWADKIFPMTLEQYHYITETFRIPDNKIEVIGITDNYDFDQSELITLLVHWWYYKGQEIIRFGD